MVGEMSEYVDVLSGVPQGSVLGPSLFIFYINDIHDNLNSTVRLFADDTICYLTIKSQEDAQTLQADLDRLGDWELKWQMEFHPEKCEVIHISNSKNIAKTEYNLQGHSMKAVESAKYLNWSHNLIKWNRHIDNTVSKANRVLGFLRRNLRVKSPCLKEKAYKTLVRPTLEYASSVWDPHTANNINKLEMVQRRAARFTVNNWNRHASVTSMLDELGWPSLEARRKQGRLTMLFKISQGLVAIPTRSHLVPVTRATRHCHELGFKIPHSRIDAHLYSFYPRTIREWNILPWVVVSSVTLEGFKSQLEGHSKI